MTNQEKNVPELRFPEFDGEWEEKKLGDIGSVAMNKRIYKNETTNHGEIPFYKIGTFGKKAETFISREKFEEYKEKYPYPNKGDILISASGSIGRTVEYDGEEAYYQDSNIVWLQHNNEVLNVFLKYFYLIVKWNGIEGTTIKRLYNKNILNTKIELPVKEEQQKIGEFFSKLDRQIELEEQKLAKLEEQKKGYMQKLFSQELRFKDENGDDYPEWMETNIRNTFDNKGGTALEKEFDNNGTHKVISIGSYSMNSTYNEQNLRINKNEFTEKYLLNEGDLAMVLNDKTKEGNIIGRSIYIDEDDKYIYNQRTERLIPVTGNNHKFLWYLMNSEQFRKKIKQMMQGATQVYINYNSIKDLSIYLPILEEQNKISNFFTKFDERIENQNQKIDGLKNRKKGFLQKMFV